MGKKTGVAAVLPVFVVGLSACGGGGGGGLVVGSTGGGFTTWGDIQPGTTVTVNGISQEADYSYDEAGLTAPVTVSAVASARASVGLNLDGELTRFSITTPDTSVTFDAGRGDTIAVADGLVAALTQDLDTAFVGADPIALGWDYQSFGVWLTDAGTGSAQVGSASFGRVAPVAAIPASGSALYVGRLGGVYVNPAGTDSALIVSDLAVTADFGARTLGFTTGNVSDFDSGAARPDLALRGTLGYAAGTNGFSGTLTNSAGTMSGPTRGRFYGPAAEELGGVFFMQAESGFEAFGGAYGGVRR